MQAIYLTKCTLLERNCCGRFGLFFVEGTILSNHIIRIVTDSCNRKLDQSDLLIWVSGDLPFVRFLRQCYSDNILW